MRYWLAILLLGAATQAEAAWVRTVNGTRVDIREEHVRISVRENVAKKHVRLVLNNSGSRRAESELFFEIDPDEVIDKFTVKIGGKVMPAELVTGEKARKIYEEIVRKQKDPALLENYGSNLIRVRVFPIEPRSTFEAEVELIQPLKVDGGVVRLSSVGTLSTRKLSHVTCKIDIENSRGVGTVFSPTHEVDVLRKNKDRVEVSYERRDEPSGGPMVLYYSMDASGATILSHDGHFMMSITPPAEKRKPRPRDIVFAVDISGSMLENNKIDQVRSALGQFIKTLNKNDRFNIIAYSTEALTFKTGFVGVDSTKDALRFVEQLHARGGTNMEEALRLANGHAFRSDAVPIVVFLSDGIPTIGERDTQKLLEAARGPARIFCFGVGYDVNTQLLDLLAANNGGDRQYIHPKESVSKVLARFAKKVNAPILSNPVVTVDGATELYPKRQPDVFEGGQVVIFGRAKGETQVTLRADDFEITYEVDFSSNARYEFVPRLWAIQKIDYLMDEIRKRGTDKELVEEIVRLSKEHLIVTPYTSFLILEDDPKATSQATKNFKDSFARGFTGKEEWLRARNQGSWRGAYNFEAQNRACSEAIGGNALDRCRQVARRNFVLRKTGWVDADYNGKDKVREIAFLGEDYFNVLRNNKEASRMLALGRNVTFQCNGNWYRVN